MTDPSRRIIMRDDHTDGLLESTKLLLSTGKAARLLDVSETTIRNWIRDGVLPAIQPNGPGTRLLIPVSAIIGFATHAGISSPERAR